MKIFDFLIALNMSALLNVFQNYETLCLKDKMIKWRKI